MSTAPIPDTAPITFYVHGTAATQGNKSGFIRGGRVVLVEGKGPGRQRISDWRHAVAAEARQAAEDRLAEGLLAGPVAVELSFWLQRPASAPKRRRTWPIGARSGDIDKLSRAVLDAITGVLISDDSQVVNLHAIKDYGDRPGVSVSVYSEGDLS